MLSTLFLKQSGAPALRAHLQRVSDPASPDWGRWLTHEEVQALQAPLPEHVELVSRYLETLAPSSVDWSTAKDKVVVQLPVSRR